MLGHILHRAALGTHAWHEQKSVWNLCANLPEHLRAGGPHHVHQPIGPLEGLAFAEHLLVQRLVPVELKIVGPGIGRQRQQDGPTALKRRERLHAVAAHVRRHGHSICPQPVEHGLRVLRGGVSNVASFGVGNDEHVARNRRHDALQSRPSLGAVLLEKRQIGLVRHRGMLGGRHNGRAKGLHATHPLSIGCGDARRVWIESNTQVGPFGPNGLEQPLRRLEFGGRLSGGNTR